MERPYRHLDLRREGDVVCVRLRSSQLDEGQLYDMCSELQRLVEDDGCRKLVLNLGPPDPEFLYSIFLAKLVSLQRRLRGVDGAMKIAQASPTTREIFEACRLTSLFDFVPDEATAVESLSRA
jgi:anti-anti-sigma factor